MTIRYHRTGLVAGVKGQEAGALAAEITEYLTKNLGMPTTWGWQFGGPFGAMHWFTDYADMAALEVGLIKTTTDPGYLAILAKADGLFLEGHTEDTVIYLM